MSSLIHAWVRCNRQSEQQMLCEPETRHWIKRAMTKALRLKQRKNIKPKSNRWDGIWQRRIVTKCKKRDVHNAKKARTTMGKLTRAWQSITPNGTLVKHRASNYVHTHNPTCERRVQHWEDQTTYIVSKQSVVCEGNWRMERETQEGSGKMTCLVVKKWTKVRDRRGEVCKTAGNDARWWVRMSI